MLPPSITICFFSEPGSDLLWRVPWHLVRKWVSPTCRRYTHVCLVAIGKIDVAFKVLKWTEAGTSAKQGMREEKKCLPERKEGKCNLFILSDKLPVKNNYTPPPSPSLKKIWYSMLFSKLVTIYVKTTLNSTNWKIKFPKFIDEQMNSLYIEAATHMWHLRKTKSCTNLYWYSPNSRLSDTYTGSSTETSHFKCMKF